MGRIIVATGLTGIAAITAIAWRQADARIVNCITAGLPDKDCVARLTATRDYILTAGLSAALIFVLAALCVAAIIKARRGNAPVEPATGWRPTSRAARVQPRLGVERR